MTATASNIFANFDEFTDCVVRKLQGVYGTVNGEIVFLQAQSSGMLNDYYGAPEWWTEQTASRLFSTICLKERSTRRVLSSFRDQFLRGAFSDESED